MTFSTHIHIYTEKKATINNHLVVCFLSYCTLLSRI